uniref:Uncharacterized protein n=1 Tax=Eutreptiella gymnastica TaxID=73025 RepID=A0A6U8KC88_9EUGL
MQPSSPPRQATKPPPLASAPGAWAPRSPTAVFATRPTSGGPPLEPVCRPAPATANPPPAFSEVTAGRSPTNGPKAPASPALGDPSASLPPAIGICDDISTLKAVQ